MRFGLVVFSLAIAGCGLGPAGPLHGSIPQPISRTDPEFTKMMKAVAAIDRKSKGFTPISPTAEIVQEGKGDGYDAMLHIYGETHRTISFRKTPTGYRWTSEQELFYGPHDYTSVDGTFQEYIAVEYQTEAVNGVPLNQVYISYSGEDPRFALRDNLKLTDVASTLKAWKGTPIH